MEKTFRPKQGFTKGRDLKFSTLDTLDQKALTEFRQALHAQPDLSGNEAVTAQQIKDFLAHYEPDQIITNVGGNGLIAIFDGKVTGPTLVFRGDMDALPIPETVDLPYSSENNNISHKCGHDGHSTMVAGLAPLMANKRPDRGRVILLFQPAEETGKGAYQVIQDENFLAQEPDFIVGLHNIPGKPLGSIITKTGPFAVASKGMIINFQGSTAHAAEPEKGKNPAFAIADLIPAIQALNQSDQFHDFTLATIIHTNVGEIAFGTSPGNGILMLTLRSALDNDLDSLTHGIQDLVNQEAREQGLEYTISFEEIFPATTNPHDEVSTIKKAGSKLKLELADIDKPFRWSEDFGHYSQVAKSCFFGLGSGTKQPELHDNYYDFPDELIPYGTQMFYQILDIYLNSSDHSKLV